MKLPKKLGIHNSLWMMNTYIFHVVLIIINTESFAARLLSDHFGGILFDNFRLHRLSYHEFFYAIFGRIIGSLNLSDDTWKTVFLGDFPGILPHIAANFAGIMARWLEESRSNSIDPLGILFLD